MIIKDTMQETKRTAGDEVGIAFKTKNDQSAWKIGYDADTLPTGNSTPSSTGGAP